MYKISDEIFSFEKTANRLDNSLGKYNTRDNSDNKTKCIIQMSHSMLYYDSDGFYIARQSADIS